MQLSRNLSAKDLLTLGATYSIGHKLNADPTLDIVSTNSQTSVTDTIQFVANNGIELPHEFALGLAYTHNNSFTVAFDYQMQQWSKVHYPKYNDTGNGKPTFYSAS